LRAVRRTTIRNGRVRMSGDSDELRQREAVRETYLGM